MPKSSRFQRYPLYNRCFQSIIKEMEQFFYASKRTDYLENSLLDADLKKLKKQKKKTYSKIIIIDHQ
jgi:hypothetical protein